MLSAGIREMKAHLSGYLEKVKQGESLTITERGHEVAIIFPIFISKKASKLARLVEKGVILGKPGSKLFGLHPPIKLKGKTMSQTILEQRERDL